MGNLPRTLQEAVKLIVENIDPDELVKTRILTRTMELESMATRAHHTLGRFFRNEFKLWDSEGEELRISIWESLTPEKRKFYEDYWKGQHVGAYMHADDASHELLVATLKHIKEN